MPGSPLSINLQGQDSTNFPTIGEVLRFDKKVDSLIAKDAKIEVLSSGFAWGEGPVWVQDGGFLLFLRCSSQPSSKVDRRRWGGSLSRALRIHGPRNLQSWAGSNGLAIDDEGRLISCEHGDRRISIMVFGEGKRTLVDNYQGKRFNSPERPRYRSHGTHLLHGSHHTGFESRKTDPTREIDFAGVYLLDRSGDVSLITDELRFPNGVELSHDERTLYVAQSDPDNPIVMAYPLDNNGKAGQKEPCSSMQTLTAISVREIRTASKIDQQGNLWVTGNGGVMIVDPKGKLIGHLSTGERTANCAWGDDGSTLLHNRRHVSLPYQDKGYRPGVLNETIGSTHCSLAKSIPVSSVFWTRLVLPAKVHLCSCSG